MAYFSEVIRTYTAAIRTAPSGWGHMYLITENLSYYITFHPDGAPLPAPSSPIVGGRQHVYTHMHFSTYNNVIDMLRNEGPVFAMYRDDAKIGLITTAAEPVGEFEHP